MTAPDFNADGYPSAGEKIGPAWEAGWAILDSDRWTVEDDLVKEMTKYEIAPKTALNLIRSARMSGVVGVKKLGNAWLYRRSILWSSE